MLASKATFTGVPAYVPYGQLNASANAEYIPSNQMRDTNGIDHFWMRSYAPQLGRWLTHDPAGMAAVDPGNPQSWNRYAYVLNNPAALADPFGLLAAGGPMCDTSAGTVYCNITVTAGAPNFDNGFDPPYVYFGPNNTGGSGGGGGGGILIIPGIRQKGQSWKQCMDEHQGDYSLIGVVDLVDAAGHHETHLQNAFVLGIVGGNSINSLFFGRSKDAAETAAGQVPGLLQAGMGSPLTYGRRTADIMAMNLAGKGGLPTALADVAGRLKSSLGSLGRTLNLGLDAATRFAADAGLTGAEALNCSMLQ